MQRITTISGTAVPLFLDDIDTDRIIPARYLRCVTFEGLGEHAFEDDRQQDPQHSFNNPAYAGASILIAGRNFGCGSSREHAPQSLMRWGIQGIVAESFAEIFFGNALMIGLPCLTAQPADIERLMSCAEASPATIFQVDLRRRTISGGGIDAALQIPTAVQEALLTGGWDATGLLLEHYEEVKAVARRLPYPSFEGS
jgi:3-isopropylmalate/(R)-2-methylmalate dehydratase small subunit